MSNLKYQAEALLEQQLREWPQAAGNYEALGGVEVKSIDMDGMNLKVQFNPARMVSSAAKVDAASLKARKCFLCGANRPEVQRGVPFGDRYTILINPFPIFPRHFTIPDNAHTDQLIKGRIADMCRLAEGLEDYTVFYNGPRCGASAPDHMHFQAGNSDFLTLPAALENATLLEVATTEGGTLSLAEGVPVTAFVIDSTSAESAEMLFDLLYEALPVLEGEAEPMMNILCYATPAGIRTVVLPRRRHRPSCYGTEGSDCILISPASVDMGGVFITPREEDFHKLDAKTVGEILDEVCLPFEDAENIAHSIKERFAI